MDEQAARSKEWAREDNDENLYILQAFVGGVWNEVFRCPLVESYRDAPGLLEAEDKFLAQHGLVRLVKTEEVYRQMLPAKS